MYDQDSSTWQASVVYNTVSVSRGNKKPRLLHLHRLHLILQNALQL